MSVKACDFNQFRNQDGRMLTSFCRLYWEFLWTRRDECLACRMRWRLLAWWGPPRRGSCRTLWVLVSSWDLFHRPSWPFWRNKFHCPALTWPRACHKGAWSPTWSQQCHRPFRVRKQLLSTLLKLQLSVSTRPSLLGCYANARWWICHYEALALSNNWPRCLLCV